MFEEMQTILAQREVDYGKAQVSFDKIAKLWSAYIGTHIKPVDVAYMMAMLKMSREKHQPKYDNRLDAANYCVLADIVQWVMESPEQTEGKK